MTANAIPMDATKLWVAGKDAGCEVASGVVEGEGGVVVGFGEALGVGGVVVGFGEALGVGVGT
jgi:hypothetical protein